MPVTPEPDDKNQLLHLMLCIVHNQDLRFIFIGSFNKSLYPVTL